MRWAPFNMSTRACVALIWSLPCILMGMSKSQTTVSDLKRILENNLENVISWSWYASIAATSCVSCIILRTCMKIVKDEEAGTMMKIIFHLGLSSVIAFLVQEIGWQSPNKPFEEIILSSIAGYCFYEMFYVRVRKSLGANLKVLQSVAVVSFIANCLAYGRGASLMLALTLMLSSPVAALELPSLASARFVNTTAYRASIWTAHMFAVYQRLFSSAPLLLGLWSSPAFRFEYYEIPCLTAIYCLAVGACLALSEVVLRKRLERKDEFWQAELESLKRRKRAMDEEKGVLLTSKRRIDLVDDY